LVGAVLLVTINVAPAGWPQLSEDIKETNIVLDYFGRHCDMETGNRQS
jgi:hypothetical protein